MEWWERLKQWRNDQRLSRQRLADLAKIDVEQLNKWEQGKVENPRSDGLNRVLNVLERTDLELFYGISEAQLAQLRRLPLINIDAMGRLRRGESARQIWDGIDTTEAHATVSDEAFGVRLGDDGCAPEGLRKGDIVIVDPKLEYGPRDFVVAILDDKKQAVFGRFSPAKAGATYPCKIIPTDEHFPSYVIDQKHPGFIVGRAAKHVRDI